ncbi:hypothetical protein EPUL_006771, partial [Erysiphe pulchra]
MGTPARDKKRGITETLDARNRIQKPANSTGRVQSASVKNTRSISKLNATIDHFVDNSRAQAVAPSPKPSDITNCITSDTQMETTPITEENQSTEEILSLQPEIPTEDFPPLPSTQSSTQSFTLPDQNTESTKSILMSKSRGLLNLVGPYLEEIERSCPEAGVEFLALISEGVS